MLSRFFSMCLAFAGLAVALPATAAVPCAGLLTVALESARVTASVPVLGPLYLAADGNTYTGVPSFCKVTAVATPTPDSLIHIELWLPTAADWNGRFQGVGNGGYAGSIAVPAPAMLVALKRQFAVATTDMGTAPSGNNNGDLLVGHPQKWEDWGHRATHLMTVVSKELIAAYYGRAPAYSYFNGCSTGGQQALMTAQRYPNDYDGILAGAPAHNRTHIHTGLVWNFQAQKATPQSTFNSDHAKLITTAVAQACNVKSGGLASDAFLTDPRACNWDPGALQCTGATATNCLSPEQVTAARRIYDGARNPANGQRIVSASTRGAESDSLFGWQSQGRAEPQFGSLFKWVFGLTWQAASYDFNEHMASVDALLAPMLNANQPDLGAFRARGGRLIAYHGTADPLIPVQESINHYHRMVQAQPGSWNTALGRTRQFARLFVVPGMAHCAGGAGPNSFGNLFSGAVLAPESPLVSGTHDAMVALQNWVEGGTAPDQLVATKYVQDQPLLGIEAQRPICAYPQFPRYFGRGDPKAATSFICADNGNSGAALNPLPAPQYLR
ncbi:tannase/feruloyl esterase family alpha/beta hydrolase [Caenimonas sedimenti]|uniref:Tannase/feruloyl esterase family alpha/beta hydrolase n=1 Tax=Caenimonas sedimenti TaxID=2596921 RepID=A0A562ZEX3_9BURK|nr:tannase/feruloyl esterase family alpha/beta hydrolase [Caenimonas sedimenti]TWO64907.1 tannase/feruloyl esterase family alpha/beta hydrolase [Caenimonas sedimenti]